jgi:hypothetical protein
LSPILKCLTIKAFAIAALVSALSCNGLGSECNQWVLELKSVSSNPLIIWIPVRVGEAVSLQFIHSWDNMPVQETFIVTGDGNLLLTEAQFTKLGAGYDAPPVSGNLILKDGKIVITDMNIKLKSIPLRIGTVAHHQLIVKERSLDLAALFGKGKRIDIQLKSIPLTEDSRKEEP